MADFRRLWLPGGTFFFTVVTEGRAPILVDERARLILRSAILETQAWRQFEIIAWVLLPDHLHTLWTLPAGDTEYSLRWAMIKRSFTRNWLVSGGEERRRTRSRLRYRRRAVWQRRYWEHTIRNDRDLENHFNYIHYNPVKHGHVECPCDWPYSTFHRWAANGYFDKCWGCGRDPHLPEMKETTGE